MNIAVWALQIILAVAFAGAGIMKLTQPREQLLKRMAYVEGFSATQMKGIGTVEVLGALGLVLPAWTGIAPILTPLAATGLAIVMVLGALVHVRRKEYREVLVPAVFFVVAVFIAIMRFGRYAY
jgi:uncharacterized membrane protein